MLQILLCILPIIQIEPKVENLLEISANYNQVHKCLQLVRWESDIITRLPCISPLCTENLLHLPISSKYGSRLHPILNEYKHHSGIDLPGNYGDRVYATANGVVSNAAVTNSPIGTYVKIKHSYGYVTTYGHLSKLDTHQGDTVKIGQTIGFVGSTGRSTGPHLHYGIMKNGREQNPLPYCYLYLEWRKMLNSEGKK